MDIVLTNPIGLYGLLAIPALLLIHFIQERPAKHVISTMFLVKNIAPNEATTRSLSRLRNSLPLWLQLFAVTLLSTLLAQPRLTATQSVQRVVLVLDDSPSMSAFQKRLEEVVTAKVQSLKRRGQTTEWVLLPSSNIDKYVYRGTDSSELLAALKSWRPRGSAVDLHSATADATRLVRNAQYYYLLSDHRSEVSENFGLLAVGEAFDNWGFAGLRAATDKDLVTFEATVKSYSTKSATKSWWVRTAQGDGERVALTLAPDEARTIRGKLPLGLQELTLVLEEDRFLADNQLPVIRPQARNLNFYFDSNSSGSTTSLGNRLLQTLPGLTHVNAAAGADILLAASALANPADSSWKAPSNTGVILFRESPHKVRLRSRSPVLAIPHPLTNNLQWQSLVVVAAPLTPLPADEVLLWQGSQPLALLRDDNKALLLNFEPNSSNALTHPAFVIMLSRFIDSKRRNALGYAAENLEGGQWLRLPAFEMNYTSVFRSSVTGNEERASPEHSLLFVPNESGFLTVSLAGREYLRAAIGGSDPRESDFRQSATMSVEALKQSLSNEKREATGEPLLFEAFLILILVLILLNWGTIAGIIKLPKRSHSHAAT